MANKKTTREEARMSLPALTELIEQKQVDLNDLHRIYKAKLRVMLRAMKKGVQIHGRDIVKDPETLRSNTYYHPTSEGVTWTGRGRVPQWFVEVLLAGETVESLAHPRFVKPAPNIKQRKAKPTAREILDGAYEEILRSAQVKPRARA